jgi:hypothetical protein
MRGLHTVCGNCRFIWARAWSTWISHSNVNASASNLTGLPITYSRATENVTWRRDAALSMLGGLVLRFSYGRLHEQAAVVTNEVDAVLQMRRRQLSVA